MNPTDAQSAPLWPFVVYSLAVVGLVVGILALSHVLGERRTGRGRDEPFESGILPVGFGRFRISAQFYVVAMLFVIFDLETVFVVAWAVSFRDLGWPGFLAASIFILILFAALYYEWRMGALEWAPKGRRAATRQEA